MTKFPYCCAALQTAQECDMVLIEHSEISWFNGKKEVVTVKVCPFCGYAEDSTITLPENNFNAEEIAENAKTRKELLTG